MLRVLVTLALGTLVVGLTSCEPTNLGYAPNQPIVYSHAVHAGALKIPCLYCHYAAERSRYAGIPPARLCLNCHTQVLKDHPEVVKVKTAIEKGEPIRWVRVHKLPDFATFDHSIHVRKGVLCQTCHGPVESMGRVTQFSPLTMGWCIDCHRRSAPAAVGFASLRLPPGAGSQPVPPAPGPGLGPSVSANRLTDCAVCHH